ncbi:hypothetical protein [Actinoplanes sp. NPDC051859]|uniref:hypothetical protein n=1 Tax=Actinoplanes sp. NPDC051859 TaxID=3363909 RepID=UPI0037ABDFDB
MEGPDPGSVVSFVQSVAVLALPAEAQVAWLTASRSPYADELALQFDDGFRLLPVFVERGWLRDTAVPALARLDEHLDAMSCQAHADLWTVEALNRVEWERTRSLALSALIRIA